MISTWMTKFWDTLRASLWFVPIMFVSFAYLLSLIMLALDDQLKLENMPEFEWLHTTAAAAQLIMGTLAGAIVTVTGVVFSITMLTLAQTTTQFGARLLRSFLNRNINQVTLGTFLGTSLYCFAVLRAIRGEETDYEFVPHLSVALGLVMGIVCLIIFIYFIHEIAYSIQANTVVKTVANELISSIKHNYPETIQGNVETVSQNKPDQWHDLEFISIKLQRTGYLQAIDEAQLLSVATQNNLLIDCPVRPGEFLIPEVPPLKVRWLNQNASEDRSGNDHERIRNLLNNALVVGVQRSPRYDVICAVSELVEVALRALSPGINDPHTAVTSLDYLAAALCEMASRQVQPEFLKDDENDYRVRLSRYNFADVLNSAMNEIRQAAFSQPAVLIRMIELLIKLSVCLKRPEDRHAVLRHAAMLKRTCEREIPEPFDLADARTRLREFQHSMGIEETEKLFHSDTDDASKSDDSEPEGKSNNS